MEGRWQLDGVLARVGLFVDAVVGKQGWADHGECLTARAHELVGCDLWVGPR